MNAFPRAATPSAYAQPLSTCCPYQLGAHFVNHLIDIHLFTFIDAASNSSTEFVAQSLFNTVSSARPVHPPLNQISAYQQDSDTKLLLARLAECTAISRANISSIHSAYRDYVRRDRLSIVEGKLASSNQSRTILSY